MGDWRQPWMTDEWIEWWKSLDHSRCTRMEMNLDKEPYELCHSMHCLDCGRSTGGQGHYNCPERTPETVARADRMLGAPPDPVCDEAEACEDL